MSESNATEWAGLLSEALAATPEPSYRAENALTMSALGGCRRRAVYALHRAPQDARGDTGSGAADVGTALHRAVLPYLAEKLGGECEVEVAWSSPAGVIKGTADLLLPDTVVDLKTVGRGQVPLLAEPRRQWVAQVTAAALATGRGRCAVLVLDRDTGESRAFEWATAEAAPTLIDAMQELSTYGSPDEAPRDFHGPGVSKVCDWCPYSRACWPDVPDAEPQAVLVIDDAAAEDALEKYLDAQGREAEARSDKDFYRRCLTGSESGQYGAFTLKWTERTMKPTPDVEALLEIAERAGEPVPYRERKPSRAIKVTRV